MNTGTHNLHTLEPVLHLSNGSVDFQLAVDGSGTVRHASGEFHFGRVAMQEYDEPDPGHVWQRAERSLMEQYPARFRAVAEGDCIRLVVLEPPNREAGSLLCHYALDGEDLIVDVRDISDALPALMFPTPIESDSLVVPKEHGRWIRKPLSTWQRLLWRFPQLNMRWSGGIVGDRSWIAIVEEGYQDAGVGIFGMSLGPLWLRSLGAWRGPRRLRYRFMRGGYNEMAAAFRAWAEAHGLIRTLREKIAENPALGNLLGGRIVSLFQASSFRRSNMEDVGLPNPEQWPEGAGRREGLHVHITHLQAADIMRDAKALGMKRGLFGLHGWLPGGYDDTHPDVWPPEQALGTTQEMAALCGEAEPFLTFIQDNYQDIYLQSPSFPHGVCKNRDGRLLRGGFWHGGQAYILDSTASLAYARRNWERLRSLGLRAIYADTITAELFKQSWEPGNTQTRSQDEALKIELLRFFKGQGLVLASECGADFGVPWLDWAPAPPSPRVPGETIPLFSLVFHDCVFRGHGFFGPGDGFDVKQLRSVALSTLLHGNFLFAGGFTADSWSKSREAFVESLAIDTWHAQVGLDRMTRHDFLTSDAQVEMTTFSSGASIIVNFGQTAVDTAFGRVEAEGHLIRLPIR
jgi:hypothetical protein